LPVFELLERIASYDWDLGSLPAIHLRLSRAMRAEELELQAQLASTAPPA
jgi:hypothetical protein